MQLFVEPFSLFSIAVTQLLNGTVQTNDEGISIVYAVVFPVLVSVTLVVVVCGVVLIVLYRKRRHQTQDLLISNPIPLGRYVDIYIANNYSSFYTRVKGRGTTVHRYIEHSKLLVLLVCTKKSTYTTTIAIMQLTSILC